MNIFENLKHSSENPSNRISEQAAVEAAVFDIKSQYLRFLGSFEKQRVILKTDFVLGSFPEKLFSEHRLLTQNPIMKHC